MNYLTKKSGLLHLSAVLERTGRIEKEILRSRLYSKVARKYRNCTVSREIVEIQSTLKKENKND